MTPPRASWARRSTRRSGQPELVHEVMAKRIIAAARKGERGVTRLRDIALAGLKDVKDRL